MKRLALLMALTCGSALAQVNCAGGFATSHSGTICSVSNSAGTADWADFFTTAAFSGTALNFVPSGSGHNGYGLIYQTVVPVTAFSSTFTFVPNGMNLVWTLNNVTNTSGYNGPQFSSGAGCEAGIYQAFGTSPNNIFGIEIDSYSYLNSTDSSYTYSSVQIYQRNQSPCSPNDSGPGYWPTTKLSTSPVSLNSPSTTQNTTTGDTYSATVTYDGATLTFSMYDVTAGNSCPGSNCFTMSWSNVSIPSMVNGTAAYVGINAGVGINSSYPLYIGSFTYTSATPTAFLGATATAAGGSAAANPTFSSPAGAYASPQTVTLASSTSGSNICYVLGSATLVLTPLPDNLGGCAVGTPYTGPIYVSSSQTLWATAGTNAAGLPSGLARAAYVITSRAVSALSGNVAVSTSSTIH